ncbi:MAG: cupredoxin domain-containing protein [Thermoplasmatota archaeon]
MSLVICVAALPGASAQTTDAQTIATHDVPSDHIQPSAITEVQGTVLTVNVTNPSNESSSHNVYIQGYDAPLPLAQMDTWTVAPGHYKTFTVTLSQAGTFPYYSTLPGDQAGGMAGTLTVQSSGGNSTGTGGAKTPAFEAGAAIAAVGLVAVAASNRRR